MKWNDRIKRCFKLPHKYAVWSLWSLENMLLLREIFNLQPLTVQYVSTYCVSKVEQVFAVKVVFFHRNIWSVMQIKTFLSIVPFLCTRLIFPREWRGHQHSQIISIQVVPLYPYFHIQSNANIYAASTNTGTIQIRQVKCHRDCRTCQVMYCQSCFCFVCLFSKIIIIKKIYSQHPLSFKNVSTITFSEAFHQAFKANFHYSFWSIDYLTRL